jgi:hypothetical protein
MPRHVIITNDRREFITRWDGHAPAWTKARSGALVMDELEALAALGRMRARDRKSTDGTAIVYAK